MPGAKPKSRRSRAWPAAPSRARKAGSAISRPIAAARAAGSPAGTRRPVSPLDEELLDGAGPGGDARQPLAGRLHQHIGQAVAVAVRGRSGWPARRDRRRARPPGSRPGSARRARRCARQGRGSRPGLSGSGSSGPPPIWTKRQARSAGSKARAARRSSKPFFSTARPMERMTTGSEDWHPSRGGRGSVGAGKRARSRPWRTRVTLRAPDASELRWAAPTAVQVTSQSQRGELLPLLPIGRRPDVLGMGRDAPGLARHAGRHSGRRRRGYAGNGRAAARCPAAARPPAPAPGRSAGRGWTSDRGGGRPATP